MKFATEVKNLFLLLLCVLSNSWLSGAQALEPKVHVVEIRKMEFQPAFLSVIPGDTVLWINKDVVQHNVTAQNKAEWASPLLPPGASWKKAISKNSAYYCSLHPAMKGKVEVE